MSKVDQILLAASLFEKRASVALKKIAVNIRPGFIYELESLLGFLPPKDDFAAWVQKNQSTLSLFPNKNDDTWQTNYWGNRLDTEKYLRLDSWDNSKDEPIYFYIGKSYTEPTSANISKSFILQGHGEIPNLWGFCGTKSSPNTVANENITKELAHESWLIEALAYMKYYNSKKYPPDFIDEVTNLIKENKSKIDYFRSLSKTRPKVLGEPGADGIALALSDRLVLKLFKDKGSFEHAKKAVERLHKHPELAKTEAMIYDIGVLGTFFGNPLYYYIIERMTAVESLGEEVRYPLEVIKNNIREIIFNNNSYWRSLKQMVKDPSKHSELKSIILSKAKEMAEKTKRQNQFEIEQIETELGDRLNENWLESFAEELIVKKLTDRRDLHMDNIGLTKYKDFRYYDPAYGDRVSSF